MAQFAALVYRVLSGSAVKYASFFTTSGYVMASGLSENGNALLAATISDPSSQPSACRFIRLLAGQESLPVTGISPLVAPPSADDLAAGKLDPAPSPGAATGQGARPRSMETAKPAVFGKPLADGDKLAETERQLALAKQAAEKEALKETAIAQRKQDEAVKRKAGEDAARQQAAAEETRRRQEEASRVAAAEQARRQAETARPAAGAIPPAPAPPAPPVSAPHSVPAVSRNRSKVPAIAAVLCVVGVIAAIAVFVINGRGKERVTEQDKTPRAEVDDGNSKARIQPADDGGPDHKTPPDNHTGTNDSPTADSNRQSGKIPGDPVVTGPDKSAESSTIVKVPGGAKTIADALRRCKEGGTVEISGGPYAEAILVTKPVSLVATSNVVIEDRGLGSNLMVVSGAIRVTLRNIQMKNTQEEIKGSPKDSPALVLIKNGANVHFDGCVIERSAGDGISLADKSSASFSHCPIRNNLGHGIHVSGASKVEVALGEIRENGRSGIALSNAGTTATLDGTVIEANAENGVVVGDGADLKCGGVAIHGNKLEQRQKLGLLVEGGGSRARLEASCVISANCVSGIGVIDGGHLDLADSTVEGNSTNGLYVKNGGQVKISSCHFNSNGPLGIALMDSPSKISISKCQFKAHSELGVVIEQGNGIVSECSFASNTAAICYGPGATGSASGNLIQPGPLDTVLIVQDDAGKVSLENNTIGTAAP